MSKTELSERNARVIDKMCRSLSEADVRVVFMLPLALMAGQECNLCDQAEEFLQDMDWKPTRRELERFSPEVAKLAKRHDDPEVFFGELWFHRKSLPLFAVKWSSGGVHWVSISKDSEPGCGTLNDSWRANFWTFGNSISACAKRAKEIAKRRSLREWLAAYKKQHGCDWTPNAAGSAGEEQ